MKYLTFFQTFSDKIFNQLFKIGYANETTLFIAHLIYSYCWYTGSTTLSITTISIMKLSIATQNIGNQHHTKMKKVSSCWVSHFLLYCW